MWNITTYLSRSRAYDRWWRNRLCWCCRFRCWSWFWHWHRSWPLSRSSWLSLSWLSLSWRNRLCWCSRLRCRCGCWSRCWGSLGRSVRFILGYVWANRHAGDCMFDLYWLAFDGIIRIWIFSSFRGGNGGLSLGFFRDFVVFKFVRHPS